MRSAARPSRCSPLPAHATSAPAHSTNQPPRQQQQASAHAPANAARTPAAPPASRRMLSASRPVRRPTRSAARPSRPTRRRRRCRAGRAQPCGRRRGCCPAPGAGGAGFRGGETTWRSVEMMCCTRLVPRGSGLEALRHVSSESLRRQRPHRRRCGVRREREHVSAVVQRPPRTGGAAHLRPVTWQRHGPGPAGASTPRTAPRHARGGTGSRRPAPSLARQRPPACPARLRRPWRPRSCT